MTKREFVETKLKDLLISADCGICDVYLIGDSGKGEDEFVVVKNQNKEKTFVVCVTADSNSAVLEDVFKRFISVG